MSIKKGQKTKTLYIATTLAPSTVMVTTPFGGRMITDISLPDGCEGVMFVFKSKKSGRAFWGKNVEFLPVAENTRKTQGR